MLGCAITSNHPLSQTQNLVSVLLILLLILVIHHVARLVFGRFGPTDRT